MNIETDSRTSPSAPTSDVGELLEFFKALADPSRLRLVGLLAQAPQTVEELAAALGLSTGTTSHHLRRLAEAGLVEARAEGYYRTYSLRDQALQERAARLLGPQALPRLAGDADLEAWERKVVQTFCDPEGRILAFPAQQKKQLVLLRHVLAAFEPGVRYTEPELNEILRGFHEDTARLRRALVEHGFMDREGGGGAYWRT